MKKLGRGILYTFLILLAAVKMVFVIFLALIVLSVGKDIYFPEEIKEMKPAETAVKTDFTNTPVVFITADYKDYTGYGSGVYIAPNKILTAAHVVSDVDGEDIQGLTVDNGKKEQVSPTNISLYRADYKGGSGDDLAIITTTSPSKTYYNVAKVDGAKNIRILGYPSIEGNVKQGYTTEGEIASNDGYTWRMTAYTEHGASGGPVVDENDRVIGILVSSVTTKRQDGDKEQSRAVKFTKDQIDWINGEIERG